jgi:hypothetical protein
MKDEAMMPPKCCGPIPLEKVERFLDQKFKEEWELKHREHTTIDRIYCPNPRCSEWIPPEDFLQGLAKDYAKCSKCSTMVCKDCRNEKHTSLTCPSNPEVEQVLSTARGSGWKRCYHCKAVVEKVDGCHHMKCRCGAEFCFECERRWKTCRCFYFDHPDEFGVPFNVLGMAAQQRNDPAQVRAQDRVAAALEAQQLEQQEAADREFAIRVQLDINNGLDQEIQNRIAQITAERGRVDNLLVRAQFRRRELATTINLHRGRGAAQIARATNYVVGNEAHTSPAHRAHRHEQQRRDLADILQRLHIFEQQIEDDLRGRAPGDVNNAGNRGLGNAVAPENALQRHRRRMRDLDDIERRLNRLEEFSPDDGQEAASDAVAAHGMNNDDNHDRHLGFAPWGPDPGFPALMTRGNIDEIMRDLGMTRLEAEEAVRAFNNVRNHARLDARPEALAVMMDFRFNSEDARRHWLHGEGVRRPARVHTAWLIEGREQSGIGEVEGDVSEEMTRVMEAETLAMENGRRGETSDLNGNEGHEPNPAIPLMQEESDGRTLRGGVRKGIAHRRPVAGAHTIRQGGERRRVNSADRNDGWDPAPGPRFITRAERHYRDLAHDAAVQNERVRRVARTEPRVAVAPLTERMVRAAGAQRGGTHRRLDAVFGGEGSAAREEEEGEGLPRGSVLAGLGPGINGRERGRVHGWVRHIPGGTMDGNWHLDGEMDPALMDWNWHLNREMDQRLRDEDEDADRRQRVIMGDDGEESW